ncbi:MAG TPA: WcbI family polysaccharide biosynthesis putative acetyltransferase [Candidatus Baltobacteraceae bacterium]|nr:WcbI family polysaccharide biosynthesis putative acetyltransferase [Candidatus Baltobacteraceae bacterium]
METLIVYGNCQAEAVATVLRKHPRVQAAYDVVYFRSFEHPTEGTGILNEADAARCRLLFEQYDAKAPFPSAEKLPEGAKRVRFPAADLHLLWPLGSVNPANVPEPPRFPHGRFSYGDAAIIRRIQSGATAAEVLEYYLERSDQELPDLEKFLRLERARLEQRDAKCDVKIAAYILEHFARERLFWTVNHPTHDLLRVLINALLSHGASSEPRLAGMTLDASFFAECFPSEVLGPIAVPIHPKVADHFGLAWYDRNEQWQYYGETRTYESYFREMIEHGVAARTSPQEATSE